jgi:hypothetical protein
MPDCARLLNDITLEKTHQPFVALFRKKKRTRRENMAKTRGDGAGMKLIYIVPYIGHFTTSNSREKGEKNGN